MIRFLTSGESHGKELSIIIEGFPSNLKIDQSYIITELKRRMIGFGRGERMSIETDTPEFTSGIRNGKTTGAPICVVIKNNDYEKWKEILAPFGSSKGKKISIPRPGHADLTGLLKYNHDDIRNVIERASARETAIRIVAGIFAKILLSNFGITFHSFVSGIGTAVLPGSFVLENVFKNYGGFESISKISRQNDLAIPDVKTYEKAKKIIKKAIGAGNTLGGSFYVIAEGLPVGLGSYVHYDRKADAKIAFNIMSINAVKSVEIGIGSNAALSYGSEIMDEIFYDKKIIRKSNFAGGIEGGMTNGQPVIVKAAMKPISTLKNPLNSVDLINLEEVKSRYERSDVTAVPACSVVAENMLAWSIAELFIEKFGGDSIKEISNNYKNYCKNKI